MNVYPAKSKAACQIAVKPPSVQTAYLYVHTPNNANDIELMKQDPIAMVVSIEDVLCLGVTLVENEAIPTLAASRAAPVSNMSQTRRSIMAVGQTIFTQVVKLVEFLAREHTREQYRQHNRQGFQNRIHGLANGMAIKKTGDI